MKQRTATQLLAITMLLAASVDEAAALVPTKQIISLQQLSADGSMKATPVPQQNQQQLMQQQKLSDKILDLGSKVPEAAVLEHKLTKMVKLEPQVEATLAKVNQVMQMPSKQKIEAVKQETSAAVNKIERAVHQEHTDKKKEKEVEEKVKVADKPKKSTKAGGLVQANQEALKSVVQMKGMVNKQLEKQGVDVQDKEVQKEIQAELKRQTDAMMAPEPETKRQKLDKFEKAYGPMVHKQLYDAVKKVNAVEGPGKGKAMDPNVVNTYATSHDSAGERLNIANQGGLQIPGSVAQTGQRMCKSGEDEVFDNCVKPAAVEEEDQLQSAPTTPEQEGSRDYGKAAMAFVGQISSVLDSGASNAELEAQSGCSCQSLAVGSQTSEVDACTCKKPRPVKKPKPQPEPLPDAPKEVLDEPVEKVKEQAEEIVKEQQEVAAEKIIKIQEKQEAKPDGLVDVFSKALARNARIKQEQIDNHQNIMSMVKTSIAASNAALDATRSSLSNGLEFTKDVTPKESRSSVEAQVAMMAGQKSAGKK